MAYSWNIYRRYLPIIKKLPKNRYDEIFGDKQRIYIPFKNEQELTSGIYEAKISNILNNHSYYIIDYKKGTCREAFGNERLVRIGRVLQMLMKKRKDCIQALEEFTTDPYRTGAKIEDMSICISRHPYDIIGMSTGRGWTSCMDNVTGGMTRYIDLDLQFGTIIAYLIRKNDKNIQNPVARINIKPYSNPANKIVLNLPVQRIYGEPIKAFQNTINKFFYEKQKDLIKASTKFSCKKGIYTDTLSGVYYTKMPKEKDIIPDRICIKVKNREESIRLQNLLFKINHELYHINKGYKCIQEPFSRYISDKERMTVFQINKDEKYFYGVTINPWYNTDLIIDPNKTTDKELISFINKYKKAKKTLNFKEKFITNIKRFYEYEMACARTNILPLIPEKKAKKAA